MMSRFRRGGRFLACFRRASCVDSGRARERKASLESFRVSGGASSITRAEQMGARQECTMSFLRMRRGGKKTEERGRQKRARFGLFAHTSHSYRQKAPPRPFFVEDPQKVTGQQSDGLASFAHRVCTYTPRASVLVMMTSTCISLTWGERQCRRVTGVGLFGFLAIFGPQFADCDWSTPPSRLCRRGGERLQGNPKG